MRVEYFMVGWSRIEIRVFNKANVRLRGQGNKSKKDQEGTASGAPTSCMYHLVSTQVDNGTSKDLDFNLGGMSIPRSLLRYLICPYLSVCGLDRIRYTVEV